MPNNMTYQLEMSFIPDPEMAPAFFLWMTDHEGHPVNLPYPVFEWLLNENPLTKKHLSAHISPMNTVMMDDDILDVSGVEINMAVMFEFLLAKDQTEDVLSRFSLGTSFSYWMLLAKNIRVFLEQGQYYPVLLSFADKGRRCLVAHWMLSREALHGTRLFHQWLQLAPSSLFAFIELGSLSINDWQNLLLDTWVNQIVRQGINQDQQTPSSIHNLPTQFESNDVFNLWRSYLMKKFEIGIFYVADDPVTMKEIRRLEQNIEVWHRPLSGRSYTETKQVLLSHLKQMITNGFKPQKIQLKCQPFSMEEPFHPYRPWQVKLVLVGSKNDKETLVENKDILLVNHAAKSWFIAKLDQLSSFSDDLLPLLSKDSPTPYEAKLSLKTVLWLRKQRELLKRLAIELEIPDSLDWRTINDQDFSVDLSVRPVSSIDTNELDNKPTNLSTKLSLHSLIDFDWKIAIGEIELSLKEFKRLVESQQRMIFLRNEWVELPIERMAEAYDELRLFETDVVRKKSELTDVLRVYVKAEDRKTERIQFKIDDHIEEYLERLVSKPNMEAYAIPSGLKGTLRPYQMVGFRWFCALNERGVGGCLADDMGLGKTIQSIAYLLHTKEQEAKGLPTLILCPTSVIENWYTELNHFAPSIKAMVYHGTDRPMGDAFLASAQSVDVVITSYHLFVRDHEWLLQQSWNTVILDEAQMIKNPGTKQSQLVRRLRSEQRFALTGTPMENKLDELWSIMDFINPGYLGSLSHFRSYFITPIEKHGHEDKLQLVRRLVQPFLLRRTKDDQTIIQDLPDKHEQKVVCHLTKVQASIYQMIVDDLMIKMERSDGIERKGLILAAITRLKQVCNHPMLVNGEWENQTEANASNESQWIHQSGKLETFLSLIHSIIGNQEKCLVFTQYVKTGKLLKQSIERAYPKTRVFFLHGGIPSDQRTALIERMRKLHGESAVFILSLKAGGVGLNLTEANHVIHFDRWWNPAVENQATDRAYRIGQRRNVHVYKLVSKGTLEEGIDQLIEKKKWLTDQVIGSGYGWVTEMTNAEVLELVSLREKVTS